jgi:RAD51-like protein 2
MPEAGLTNAEASDVLKTLRFGIQGTSLAGARSASEILYEENCKLAIFTFSKDLDDLLGGGIAVGEITELCGCPGIGKTQACIQLCVSVQMPKAFGGYEGSAVYIDTEGSFMAERAREMARATVGHLFSISRFLPKQPSGSDPLAQFTEEAILDRFHLFRCHEIT